MKNSIYVNQRFYLENNQLTKTSILTLAPLKWDRLNELNIGILLFLKRTI
jgi:hypothetical protein